MFDDMPAMIASKVSSLSCKEFRAAPLRNPVHILDVRKIDVGFGTYIWRIRRYRCDHDRLSHPSRFEATGQ